MPSRPQVVTVREVQRDGLQGRDQAFAIANVCHVEVVARASYTV